MSLSGKAVGSREMVIKEHLHHRPMNGSFLFFPVTKGQGFYLLLFPRCSRWALICISASYTIASMKGHLTHFNTFILISNIL